MVKLLDLLREVVILRLKQVTDFVEKPILTQYHGTSNKSGEINLKNLKTERGEGMEGHGSGFSGMKAGGECIGFYTIPNKDRAITYANSSRNKYFNEERDKTHGTEEEANLKAQAYVYEIKLKSDIALYDEGNPCVQKNDIEDFVQGTKVKKEEFDGFQSSGGEKETVIWNKDKIQSIRLILIGRKPSKPNDKKGFAGLVWDKK